MPTFTGLFEARTAVSRDGGAEGGRDDATGAAVAEAIGAGVTGSGGGIGSGAGVRMESSGCHVSEPSSQSNELVSTPPEARSFLISSKVWGP